MTHNCAKWFGRSFPVALFAVVVEFNETENNTRRDNSCLENWNHRKEGWIRWWFIRTSSVCFSLPKTCFSSILKTRTPKHTLRTRENERVFPHQHNPPHIDFSRHFLRPFESTEEKRKKVQIFCLHAMLLSRLLDFAQLRLRWNFFSSSKWKLLLYYIRKTFYCDVHYSVRAAFISTFNVWHDNLQSEICLLINVVQLKLPPKSREGRNGCLWGQVY